MYNLRNLIPRPASWRTPASCRQRRGASWPCPSTYRTRTGPSAPRQPVTPPSSFFPPCCISDQISAGHPFLISVILSSFRSLFLFHTNLYCNRYLFPFIVHSYVFFWASLPIWSLLHCSYSFGGVEIMLGYAPTSQIRIHVLRIPFSPGSGSAFAASIRIQAVHIFWYFFEDPNPIISRCRNAMRKLFIIIS